MLAYMPKLHKSLKMIVLAGGLGCLSLAATSQETRDGYAWEEGIERFAYMSNNEGDKGWDEGSVDVVCPQERTGADGCEGTIERTVYNTKSAWVVEDDQEVGAYFATWSVYGRDYDPADVPVQQLTHVYMAFAAVCGDNRLAWEEGAGVERACSDPHNGERAAYYVPSLDDPMEDDEVTFFDDEWAWFDMPVSASHLSGIYQNSMVGAMVDWKSQNPDLKIIMSIGGWSYSRPFYDIFPDPERRKTLIASILENLQQPGFEMIDGVDIDFEFPGGNGLDTDKGNPSVDGAAYLTFVTELRDALDKLGKVKDREYELTAAIGVGPDKLENWAQSSQISALIDQLDRLGLMSYDFEGAWSPYAGLNSALWAPSDSPQVQSIDGALDMLVSMHGVRQDQFSKISVGYPSYSRSALVEPNLTDPLDILFAPTAGGGGENGTVERGIMSYFHLIPEVIGDGKGVNSWKVWRFPEMAVTIAYYPPTGEFHSFMSGEDVHDVARYVKDKGLRGVFTWQIDDDNGELLEAANQGMKRRPGVYNHGHADKSFTYAPPCALYLEATGGMPHLPVSDDGRVWKAESWVENCPSTSENGWRRLGDYSKFEVIYGLDWDPDLYDYYAQAAVDTGVTDYNDPSSVCSTDHDPNNPFQYQEGTKDYLSGDIAYNRCQYYQLIAVGLDHQARAWAYEPGVGETWQVVWREVAEESIDLETASGGTYIPPEDRLGEFAVNDAGGDDNADPNAYVEGSPYAQGDVVTKAGDSYSCIEPSFCSGPAWAYEPGVGSAWEQAWELIGDGSSDGGNGGADDPDAGNEGSGGIPEWSSDTVYLAGDQVTYGGETWEAQWWTQGDEPGTLTWDPWKVVSGDGTSDEGNDGDSGGDSGGSGGSSSSGDSWSADTVYLQGDRVSYDGKTWEAQWWTQGDVPGGEPWGPWLEI